MRNDFFTKWMALATFLIISFLLWPGTGLSEKSDSYLDQGTKSLKEGRLERAISDFTEAIRFDPENVEAYNNRGLAYLEQKKLEEAKEDFFRALAIAPNDINTNNNLGVFYCGREDYDSALLYIQRATAAQTLSGPFGAVVYRNLGFIYTKKRMPDKAMIAYDKAKRMAGSRSFSHLDLREYTELSQDYALTLGFRIDNDE